MSVDLPGTVWVGRNCAGSWFPHAQAPGPASAEHAGRYAPWLDPGAGAALCWPLTMQCHTETATISTLLRHASTHVVTEGIC